MTSQLGAQCPLGGIQTLKVSNDLLDTALEGEIGGHALVLEEDHIGASEAERLGCSLFGDPVNTNANQNGRGS